MASHKRKEEKVGLLESGASDLGLAMVHGVKPM